ncbi:MAG: DUF4129 domain-containing protein [Halobacteriaceae archaeon]
MALNREAAGAIVVALLAVLGVGLIAATITTTYTTPLSPEGAGGGGGGNIYTGPGDGGDRPGSPGNTTGDPDPNRSEPVNIPSICVPILTEPGVILGVVAAFTLVVAVSYRQFELLGAAFTIYLVGLPVTLGYALATQCPQQGGGGLEDVLRDPVGPFQPGPGSGGAASMPPSLVVALFGLAGVGAVVMLLSASGDETVEPVPSVDDGAGAPDLSQFAAAAGEAADRIAANQASVDNAVYRAWAEMTALLDVGEGAEARATTSGEFAEAAVDAGLAADDVERLTRLFEEVRYGSMDPAPREELALETLRAIESAYGDGSDPAEGGADATDDADDAADDPDGPDDAP